jgi:hypothetical protein
MDMLGVQSIAVLNNPKSSFFQALSLFEFPNAFRGLNPMAGKATTGDLVTVNRRLYTLWKDAHSSIPID